MKLTFEWDEVKAKGNIKKHKVGFEEGKTIFWPARPQAKVRPPLRNG